ncbi:MAG: Mpv17/PMP22 family protein, partial [Bacillota bacterium]
GLIGFTIIKTIPLFWIPAHTITFSLPGEYQIVVAAFLSIVLGIFLSLKKS